MKNVLIIIAVVLVIAVGGGVYYLYTNLDTIVARAIEKYGSQATQTQVSVDGVRIQLGEGAATIEGLSVGNPDGFVTDNVFQLGRIRVAIDAGSLMSDTIVFNAIDILQPQVFFEINGQGRDNLTILKNNLAGPAEEEPADSRMPDLLIRRFQLSEASLHAEVRPVNRSYDLNLPALTLSDIGGPGGAQPGQIARDLLTRLLNHVQERVRQEGIGQVVDRVKGEVETRKQELMDKSRQKLDAEKQRAKDKLKGLLNQ